MRTPVFTTPSSKRHRYIRLLLVFAFVSTLLGAGFMWFTSFYSLHPTTTLAITEMMCSPCPVVVERERIMEKSPPKRDKPLEQEEDSYWNEEIRKPRLLMPRNHALLLEAKHIQAETGMLFLQMADISYANVTKSWLCNVKDMQNVIRRTLFIVTSEEALVLLQDFSKRELEAKGYARMNLVFIAYQPREYVDRKYDDDPERAPFRAQLRFGERSYWDLMVFRTGLLVQLLRSGVSVFLIESDAMWHSNPTTIMLTQTVGDFATMDDFYSDEPEVFTGGFLLIRSTNNAIKIMETLHEKQIDIFDKNGEGNEQRMLTKLVKASPFPIKTSYLDQTEFVSGANFNCLSPFAVVTHNNHENGIRLKVQRMKDYGYWFLSSDNNKCIPACCKSQGAARRAEDQHRGCMMRQLLLAKKSKVNKVEETSTS